MGKVSGNWLTGAHSGSACHHDSIYTKVNKKTGACYSVKLCNPNTESNENQQNAQNAFALVSKAASAWITTEKAANSADYKKAKAIYDRQSKYTTIRGLIIAKGMYTVSDDKQTVTVDLDARTNFKAAFGIESSTGESSGGSSTSGGTTTTKYTLTLVASPAAGGSVSGGGQYTAGTAVSISATAKAGYTFSKWSDGSTSASRSVTVNANQTLTATFVVDGDAGKTPEEGDDDSAEA